MKIKYGYIMAKPRKKKARPKKVPPIHRKKPWTSNENKILIRMFPDTVTSEIAAKLNRSYSSVSNQAYLLKLKKSPEFLSSLPKDNMMESGKQFRFQKGHTPSNKGKKWDEYVSKESQKQIRKTTFKKGGTPPNTLHDGAITVRTDTKTQRSYKHIRIGLSKWKMLHVYNWEKVHGKVPKDYIVVFKTSSTENCEVENLELITRAENMIRNTIHRYPEEIKSTIKLLSKLKKKIHGK